MKFLRGVAVVVSWVVCIFAVVILQAVFRILIGGEEMSQIVVVASTLLFVMLLFPARRKLQDFIDQRLR